MNEHVVPALTLDEAKTLLIRKPFNGAFSQLVLLHVPLFRPPTDGA
jgi:hypothetical protein